MLLKADEQWYYRQTLANFGMKYVYTFFVVFEMLSCRNESNYLFNKKISRKLHIEQSKYEKSYADAAYFARKRMQIMNNIIDCKERKDTLFIIQRVNDPTMESLSFIWSSKRDSVIIFTEKNKYRVHYSEWPEPLRKMVEQYDTKQINRYKPNILGGYKVFITQKICDETLNTYYFDDFSSTNYLHELF